MALQYEYELMKPAFSSYQIQAKQAADYELTVIGAKTASNTKIRGNNEILVGDWCYDFLNELSIFSFLS